MTTDTRACTNCVNKKKSKRNPIGLLNPGERICVALDLWRMTQTEKIKCDAHRTLHTREVEVTFVCDSNIVTNLRHIVCAPKRESENVNRFISLIDSHFFFSNIFVCDWWWMVWLSLRSLSNSVFSHHLSCIEYRTYGRVWVLFYFLPWHSSDVIFIALNS